MDGAETAESVPEVDALPATAMGLDDRLAGLRLPPTQRRVVRYIAAHPQETALLSSTDLAERIGVSQATITRVAASLGFAGFAELRDEFRARLYAKPQGALERSSSEAQTAVLRSIDNLQSLHDLLADPEALLRAAHMLAASRPLVVVATRISEPLGRYLAYRLQRCHPDVRLVTRGDSLGADRLVSAVHAGATAMLCVNLPRYAADTLALLDMTHELDLKTVMITDNPSATGTHLADVAFAVPVGTGLVFDSHAAPTVFASVLVDAVSDARGAEGQVHLEVLEEFADRWGTFVD